MNFIKSSTIDLLSKSSLINVNRNFGILSKPKKIKGVIEPQPHRKVDLIDGVNQPEFLKYLKPTVPYYDIQNIQIKGYDHVTLDEFKKYVLRILGHLDIKITRNWSTPCQELAYETLQNESYGIEDTNRIRIYERNIQIDEMASYKAPVLIEMLMLSKPPGVKIAIEKHDPKVLDKLYMIDLELEKAKKDAREWSAPAEELAKTKKGLY